MKRKPNTGVWIAPPAFLRKHELPTPLAIGFRILAGQGMRQLHAAVTLGEVLLVDGLHTSENLNDPVVQTRRRPIRKQAERSGTEFGDGRHEDTSANRGGTSPDDGILLCPDASCQSLGSVDLSQFENGDHFDESLAVSFASAIVGDTTH